MTLHRSSALAAVLALVASVLVATATQTSATAAPATVVRAATVGQPPSNYVIPPTSFFNFPNRSGAERVAIRNRVLNTIRSTWGGPKSANGLPLPGNGTIRIATWTFKDWDIARALVAARNRGVSVQLVAAASPNKDNAPWHYLQRRLGSRNYRPGVVGSRELVSFARQCKGSCRGAGGTPHAKYFLFDNVGSAHRHGVVVQTSANLTMMAVKGQWNQADVSWDQGVYDHFMDVYREARIGRRVHNPYRVYHDGSIVSIFFPRPGTKAGGDPVWQTLNQTSCTGATAGGNGNGRTRIRVINYAIYQERGIWLAKKLRYLWNRGCDVKVIYSLITRPVLGIFRSGSGRGPIPMRQSVIRNRSGEIVKYNHSKWMTITGHWGGAGDSFITFAGSANWANLAFGSDEQHQRISSRTIANRHIDNFDKVWRQGSSKPPRVGRIAVNGRMLPAAPEQVTFGKGQFKHLTPYG